MPPWLQTSMHAGAVHAADASLHHSLQCPGGPAAPAAICQPCWHSNTAQSHSPSPAQHAQVRGVRIRCKHAQEYADVSSRLLGPMSCGSQVLHGHPQQGNSWTNELEIRLFMAKCVRDVRGACPAGSLAAALRLDGA